MKENEIIESYLLEYGFTRGENRDEWNKDTWNIRFFEDEMEIYEDINKEGGGRYLLTEIDAGILKEILEEI